jgi:hypothetical protein
LEPVKDYLSTSSDIGLPADTINSGPAFPEAPPKRTSAVNPKSLRMTQVAEVLRRAGPKGGENVIAIGVRKLR